MKYNSVKVMSKGMKSFLAFCNLEVKRGEQFQQASFRKTFNKLIDCIICRVTHTLSSYFRRMMTVIYAFLIVTGVLNTVTAIAIVPFASRHRAFLDFGRTCVFCSPQFAVSVYFKEI
jgi:hypothetical protein